MRLENMIRENVFVDDGRYESRIDIPETLKKNFEQIASCLAARVHDFVYMNFFSKGNPYPDSIDFEPEFKNRLIGEFSPDIKEGQVLDVIYPFSNKEGPCGFLADAIDAIRSAMLRRIVPKEEREVRIYLDKELSRERDEIIFVIECGDKRDSI